MHAGNQNKPWRGALALAVLVRHLLWLALKLKAAAA